MGQQLTYLQRPITVKESEQNCTEDGISYAVSSMQGWRRNMEDAHVSDIHFSTDKNSMTPSTASNIEGATTTTTTSSDAQDASTAQKEEEKLKTAENVDMEKKDEKEEKKEEAKDEKEVEGGYPDGTLVFGVFDGHGGK